MPKVFVTQEVSAVDYSPAAVFGDLVFVTSYNDRFSAIPTSLNNANTIEKIKSMLSDFNSDDYLICTGAPATMAICGAVLGGKLHNLLVWDNRSMSYFEIKLKEPK